MEDLERELEFELHRVLDPILGVAIPARRSPMRHTYLQRLAGGAGGALAVKVLTGVAVAAAAATVVTAASTGTLDPTRLSRGINESVETCKSTLAGQQGGIGQCVSAIAQHHGAPASYGQSGNGQGAGNGKDNSHGNGNGAAGTTPPGQAKDKTKPTPPGRGGPPAQATPKGK